MQAVLCICHHYYESIVQFHPYAKCVHVSSATYSDEALQDLLGEGYACRCIWVPCVTDPGIDPQLIVLCKALHNLFVETSSISPSYRLLQWHWFAACQSVSVTRALACAGICVA